MSRNHDSGLARELRSKRQIPYAIFFPKTVAKSFPACYNAVSKKSSISAARPAVNVQGGKTTMKAAKKPYAAPEMEVVYFTAADLLDGYYGQSDYGDDEGDSIIS
jgi:hypothetical protein